MHIAAAGIRGRLQEMVENRNMLGLDRRTLSDAYDFIGHLVERIEELENPIGPPYDEDVQIPPRPSEQVVVKFIPGGYRTPRIVTDPEE